MVWYSFLMYGGELLQFDLNLSVHKLAKKIKDRDILVHHKDGKPDSVICLAYVQYVELAKTAPEEQPVASPGEKPAADQSKVFDPLGVFKKPEEQEEGL